MKRALRTVLGRASVTAEQLNTILCEIEAVVNSRLLTFVSNSIGEPEVLTPAHFLVGKRLTALPTVQLDLLEQRATDITKKWYYRQALMNAFWMR